MMNTIEKDYWYEQAKQYIQINYVTNNNLDNITRRKLDILYSKITSENGVNFLYESQLLVQRSHNKIMEHYNDLFGFYCNYMIVFLFISGLLMVKIGVSKKLQNYLSFTPYYHLCKKIQYSGFGFICLGIMGYIINVISYFKSKL